MPVYGPYAGAFLAGGRGLEKPLNAAEPLLAADAPWTVSLWFHADQPVGTTLLAGFGDPADEDSRYLGLRGGKPVLRLGVENEVLSTKEVSGEGWHQLAATFDGAVARLYLDGAQVAQGVPAMGPVERPELLLAPEFLSDQEARFRWDEAHLPSTVPPRLAEWHHFSGRIAAFRVAHTALSADEIKQSAADRPDFDTILFEDGSKPWFFQTKQNVGYVTPQPPDTLPVSRSPFARPVAKPLPPSGDTLEQTAPRAWTLARNWRLQAAPQVQLAGEKLSQPGAGTKSWYAATVPGTVLTTLVDRGVYPDPMWDLNNLAIPESLNKQDYWYRVEFPKPEPTGRGGRYTLELDGINYAAEVWLNGHALGTITGAFLRGSYDVTALLKPEGQNVLAVRIAPPPHPGIPNEQSLKGGPGDNGGAMLLDGPTFADTEGWDWIPAIRDRDSGIWQDVVLRESGAVKFGDPRIVTELPLPRTDTVDVAIEVPLENSSAEPVVTTFSASFEGGVEIGKQVTAPPGKSVLKLTPAEFPALHIVHPRLWWPNGYGKPELYHLHLALGEGDEKTVQFGMREVTYEASLFAPDGSLRRVEVNPTAARSLGQTIVDVSHEGMRQTPLGWAASLARAESPAVIPVTNEPDMADIVLKVNGVRIAARGGNWGMEDAMKRISREHLEPFFRLHQLANVNIIRNWMGQNTEPVFYDLADEYGLMVWNDFWDSTQNWNAEPQDPELFLRNAADTVARYRNHPSIVMWCGRNEGVPQPALNDGLAKLLTEEDGTRYYSPSSNQVNLRNSGPYKYQDPKRYFDTLNRGFSVELGVPSFSTLESFQAWTAPANQWPLSDSWAYHDWHQVGNGDVHPWMDALDKQFGAPGSLPDFERKAQMLNYALHRAIFEGFNAHLWSPNSGRMIWMTQPAWPSNMWQMFSWDYDTQASFYGVMHALEPRHVQLDPATGDIAVVNTTPEPLTGATVEALGAGLDGKTLYSKSLPAAVGADAGANVLRLPLADLFRMAGRGENSADEGRPLFVRLNLKAADGSLLSKNFYWLAARDEEMRRLNALPEAAVLSDARSRVDGSERVIAVTLRNRGTAAALALKLTLKDARTGARILPAYYSDNYVSLLPGESATVSIRFPAGLSDAPALGMRGYNLTPADVPVH